MSTVASNLHLPAVIRDALLRRKIGMLFFLAAEAMFFAGLISSYIVLNAGTFPWPPVGQPRLPVAMTGFNTLLLLLSGYAVFKSDSLFNRNPADRAFKFWLAIGAALGLAFLAIQGYEWFKLMQFGLKSTENIYAGTFYAVIGSHAVHALGGLIYLCMTLLAAFKKDPLKIAGQMLSAKLYWVFVVGVWPVLYWLVYLSE